MKTTKHWQRMNILKYLGLVKAQISLNYCGVTLKRLNMHKPLRYLRD